MKFLLCLSLFSWVGFTQESEKPLCNAKTRGQFWPAEANGNRNELQKYIQQGDLQICMYGTFKYKWTRMTVNVHDLGRDRNPVSNVKSEEIAKSANAQP
jgi:hypothetical protein